MRNFFPLFLRGFIDIFKITILLILLSGLFSHVVLASPLIFQHDFSSKKAPLPVVTSTNLIPDNFRFSQKKSLLGRLYNKLQKVRSKDSIQKVSDAIEQLWLTSGSDLIDRLMNNALVAIEEKDHAKAAYILGKIISVNPHYTEAWNKRAMVYVLSKNYPKAMADLQKVLTLDPNHFRAIQSLAAILETTGHHKSALKAYKRLLQINPHLNSAIEAAQSLNRKVHGQKT